MKNYVVIALLILTIIGINASCEKDDLCDPSFAATPRLIIVFRDIVNPEVSKSIDELQLKEVSSTEFAPLNGDGATRLIDVDSIAIPLKINDNNTRYEFIKTDGTGSNTDLIDINYNTSEVYVNRACGYKVIYNNLGAAIITDNDQWIIDTQIITTSVTSNNDIHLEIRH